jgi:mRNA interferase MazF
MEVVVKRFDVFLVNLDPTRVICQFQGKEGQIVLDQIRTIDKTRLVKKVGQINQNEQKTVLDILAEMFSE